MGERKCAYRILVGKPEGKRQLARSSRKCLDNIKMDFQEVGCWSEDWIELDQGRNSWRALAKRSNKILGSKLCGEFLD